MNSNVSFVSEYLTSNDKHILDSNAKISMISISDSNKEIVVAFKFTNEIFTTIFEKDNEWLYNNLNINGVFYSDYNTISSVIHLFNMKYTFRSISNNCVFLTFKSN